MDIKFAIVGCGRIAQRHAEHINKLGTLKAVCDIDYKKALELGQKYNAASYQDFDEMLVEEKKISVVSVCT
ncbi:MAG TPA: Gfo/Idh/MocA family oxidoreductase, partial [Segetibacter sp.]